MKNLVRTLIYHGQVSLTLADTTEMVARGRALHKLSKSSAHVFGKALSLMTFMASCLKEEKGEISLSLKGDVCGEIAVSGNRQLNMRGYILNTDEGGEGNEESEQTLLGGNSYLTVIRDDGYSRPFVGACALPEGAGLDEGFEEYFRISEQLPTRLRTVLEQDENGKCLFAGVVAVQPLPFADEETLAAVASLDLSKILKEIKKEGTMVALKSNFDVEEDTLEVREAQYKCNCSREYLSRVMVSLGEIQLRQIIREDGAVRVHCHYCNTDYEFFDEDIDRLFQKE